MFLILSGAYIGAELESEFGRIPPSFLPLGNRRLFQHQIESAPDGIEVYLTIPESYIVSIHDTELLDKKNVQIIKVVDGLTLGEAIVAALNIAGNSLDESLHLLFGDTLIPELPFGDDIVGISEVSDSYNWAILSNDTEQVFQNSNNEFRTGQNKVVNGYFNFSNPRQIIKSITQKHWDFISGLNSYNDSIKLSTVDVINWFDFGHVNTYYHSKTKFTTQRSFNDLQISPLRVKKSSENPQKIQAEAEWFSSLPSGLRLFIPQFLGESTKDGKYSYQIEYLHNTALNELFVFGELPSLVWEGILNSCFNFIDECKTYVTKDSSNVDSITDLFSIKTSERLNQYSKQRCFDLEMKYKFNAKSAVSVSEILDYIRQYLIEDQIEFNVIHGDFCFSNILFDFRSNKIKTIDPRGILNSGEFSIYGSNVYDLAKLSHSIIGMYDWIIAGYFDVEISDESIHFELSGLNKHKQIQEWFMNHLAKHYNLKVESLYSMQIHLFLSMLPLHADSPKRQDAFFANSFRLFHKLKELSL